MLDAYIIDAIRQEELERERAFERARVRLEIPIERPRERPAVIVPEMGDPFVIPLVPDPDPDLEENAA
jgi:hypothetical protein